MSTVIIHGGVCLWFELFLTYRVARVEQTETPQMMEERIKNSKLILLVF